jgi:hypothetical protein
MPETNPAKVEMPGKPGSYAGAKVIVYCKVANGLQLPVFKFQDVTEVGPGGSSRTLKQAFRDGDTVVVEGPAHPTGLAPRARIVGGYAVTTGVDKEHWERWLRDNKDSAAVKNHMIAAFDKSADGDAWAKEHAKVRSNAEPLLPDGDPRRPRPRGGVAELGSDQRDAAA